MRPPAAEITAGASGVRRPEREHHSGRQRLLALVLRRGDRARRCHWPARAVTSAPRRRPSGRAPRSALGLEQLGHQRVELIEAPQRLGLERADNRRLLHDAHAAARHVDDLRGHSLAASVASQATTGAICCGPRLKSLASTFSPRASASGIVIRVAAPGEIVLTVQRYFRLLGDHAAETGDPGLGRAVVRLAEVAEQPRDRREVDDRSRAGCVLDVTHERPRAAVVARVHGDHRVPVGLLHVVERLVAQDAGVVDQDVEPAERVDRARKIAAALGGGDRVVVADRLAAGPLDFRDDLVRDLRAPVPSVLTPRSLTTTFAPSLANISAISRPMPRPAPVTIATLPASTPMLSSVVRRHPVRRRLRTAQRSWQCKGCRRLNARGAARVAAVRGLDLRQAEAAASLRSAWRWRCRYGSWRKAGAAPWALPCWRPRFRPPRPDLRRPRHRPRHRGHRALPRRRRRAPRARRWRPWIGLVARTQIVGHGRTRIRWVGLRRALLSPLVAPPVSARAILRVVAAERLHVPFHRGASKACARTEGGHGLQPFGWHGVRDAASVDGLARVARDVEQFDRSAVLCLGSGKRHATVLHLFGDEHAVLRDRGLGYSVERPPRAFFDEVVLRPTDQPHEVAGACRMVPAHGDPVLEVRRLCGARAQARRVARSHIRTRCRSGGWRCRG